MRFTVEKKQTIIRYILEKIEQGEKNLSSAIISNFNINEATFYKYINELLEEKVIKKIQRGKYQLISHIYRYSLTRESGDLDRDTIAYDKCLYQHVRNFEKNVEQIWNYTFSEMTNNVMDHSNAEKVAVIVEQNYIFTKVWLIDDGIGIFRKIKDYFHLDQIDEAVDELFKGKVTTDAKHHSGEGIFFSSRMMDEFCIVSDGRLFSHNKYNQEFLHSLEMPFQTGTAVMMKLSNFSRRTPYETFAQYESKEGAFDKTEIKLKMIFDSAPVSRSQAKRLCNGLDRFTTVRFDFDGIEWMGQGFADEIFRIFANAHPEITLLPVHMNEDTKRMYRHVVSG